MSDPHDPREHEHDEGFDATPHRPRKRTVAIASTTVVALFVALFVVGYVPRLRRDAQVAHAASQVKSEVPVVVTAKAERAKTNGDVVLPATVQPLQETTVYARTNGYVKRWLVDIGEAVTEDQLLAEIETPELDQELAQARAASASSEAVLLQTQTHLDLAKTNLARTQNLAASGLASQQELDQQTSNVRAEEANVKASQATAGASQANVRRLLELRKFAHVTAPFAGTVTSRTTEIGALVTSGNGAGQALFKIAATKIVRIFVNVPQLYASGIREGLVTAITTRELSDRTFTGKVTRTTKSLDPVAHTLRTEIQVPNDDGALLPGMYAQVKIATNLQVAPIVVPATALSFGPEGTRVAVLRDGVVHWQKVQVETDLGDKLSIAAGLDEGAVVVLTPSDRLSDGMHVDVAPQPPAKP